MDNLKFDALEVSFDSLNLTESVYKMDQGAIDALSSIGELTEEDAGNLRTIFEAAVNNKVKELTEQVAQKYQGKLEELTEEIKQNLTGQVSDYLEVVINEWFEENKQVIEESVRSERNELLIEQIVNALKANYVEIPTDRKDLLEELSNEVKSLKQKLEESNDSNVQLKLRVNGMKCEQIVKTLSEGLADTETEKFVNLIEDLEINDVNEFEKKAKVIRESFFKKSKNSETVEVKEERENNDLSSQRDKQPKTPNKVEAAARILGKSGK